MMESQDTSEELDWQKRYKLSEQLVQCGILNNPHVDDQITELQFLYICRDIFGLNTFDIEESLPELEMDGVEEEDQEEQMDEGEIGYAEYDQQMQGYAEGAPEGYIMESPTVDQQTKMSDIRETTGEYEYEDEEQQYQGHQYISDL